MAKITLPIQYNIRDYSKRIQNFNVLSNVSVSKFDRTQSANVVIHPKQAINSPEWSFNNNDGVRYHWKKHNNFRDQELYNRRSRSHIMRHGTAVKYYVTSYNPDELYREDNNRVIERVFDLPIIFSFQPEAELYAKFGIQQLDETETHVHMSLFYEMNYQSLRKHGIAPKCPETEHNPIYHQRGYDMFRYYGYTYDQIGPKVNDKIKIEAFDTLYEIEAVNDASPEYQHRWRKYFWKVMLRDAIDSAQTISEDVFEDTDQKAFLGDLLGTNIIDEDTNEPIRQNPFDLSTVINDLKEDVLFHPPEVEDDVKDLSKDQNWYPGFDRLGGW
jgi:hypothetical protein